MNGTTNKERTLYFETMPANQLEAGCSSADRMRALAIVKDNLDNQRNAAGGAAAEVEPRMAARLTVVDEPPSTTPPTSTR
jgi:hypothetical protein